MKRKMYTIGHGTRSWENFATALKKYQVRVLIDVRSRPYSRFNPHFNRKYLDQALPTEGIRYLYMGDELGGRPSDPELHGPDGKPDYEIMRGSKIFKAGIKKLIQVSALPGEAAIMCSERDPRTCHRALLIAPELEGAGLDILHIDVDDEIRQL